MPRRELPRRPDAADAAPVMAATAPLVVGRVGGAFGVKGWLHIVSYTDPITNLMGYRPWYLRRDAGWTELNVIACQPHGTGLVVKIEGVDDRTAAQRLSGREIGVPEDVLPRLDADEYYWKDLIGMMVVTADGTTIGRVDGLMETGAHDVIVVTSEDGEMLIPFVAAVVGDVDTAAGRIVVDWTASPPVLPGDEA